MCFILAIQTKPWQSDEGKDDVEDLVNCHSRGRPTVIGQLVKICLESNTDGSLECSILAAGWEAGRRSSVMAKVNE